MTIEELYKCYKTDNLVSVGISRKQTGGIYTENESVTFTLLRKLPPSEIADADIIPPTVIVDGKEYPTDVIVGKPIRPVSPPAPDPDDPFDDWRFRTVANNFTTINPLQGGIGINFMPYNWVGTGGVFCKDNDTGALCMLTCTHVLATNNLRVADRSTSDTPNYENRQLGQDVRAIGRVYKFNFLSDTDANYIDCALLTIDDGETNLTTSRKQFGMTPDNITKFATTAELDTIGFNTRIYSSGAKTGPKGELGTLPDLRERTVMLFVSETNVSTLVGPYERFGTSGFYAQFLGGYRIKASRTDASGTAVYGAIMPGDSGSAVYAEFSGEMKIVGLVYAGSTDGYSGIFCRIDHIATALNISEWAIDPITPSQNELLPTLNSATPEYLDIAGLDTAPFKIVGAKKYWAIGTIRK